MKKTYILTVMLLVLTVILSGCEMCIRDRYSGVAV